MKQQDHQEDQRQMAEQLLERKTSTPDLADSDSHDQQFRQPEKTEDYSSASRRQAYHPTQQSFNEQRDEYTEQAFNAYENGNGSGSADSTDSSHAKPPPPASSSSIKPEPPPPVPTGEGGHAAGYDSALDRLEKKRDSAVAKEGELYHSIKHKRGVRLTTANRYQKKQPMTEKEAAHRLVNGKKRSVSYATFTLGNRLLLQGTEKRLTQKGYDRRERKKHRKKYVRDAMVTKAVRKGRLLFDDGSIPDDEDAAAMKNVLRKGAAAGRIAIRENSRNIRKQTGRYARLRSVTDREKLLDAKINRRIMQNAYRKDREAAKALQQKAERKKKMQQARMQRKAREGNLLRRTRSQLKLRKKSVEQKARKTKRILSTAVSVLLILTVLLFSNIFLMIFGMIALSTSAGTYAQTIIPVDYSVMSECTAYYRKLETDLTEKLMDTETLEEEIRAEYGDDIYGFVYDLADISFDSPTLVAYLGAKYAEFTLADVQAELDGLFALNYVLHTETKMEYREEAGKEVKICYVTLEKVPLEDIETERLDEEQMAQYSIYRISTGGQQVYGPVMREDWTGLVSSNYGERIHPITKERTVHNGVDIAIPLGTPLYSAVDGTVTVAQNSSTAGNYVRIQNSNGWTVTFMHMDSFTVAVGDTVKQGDFVGYSGNTGRSTGPHLHLEVRDQDGNTVNPIFIIPQNCAYVETDED